MGVHVIKMPDIGEGVAEAELVEWQVELGAQVREDDVLAAVMTDKATVEIPAPRDGRVIWLGADIGEQIAVGAPLLRMEIEGDGNVAVTEDVSEPPTTAMEPQAHRRDTTQVRVTQQASESEPSQVTPGTKPLAAPSVRRRARESGVDLRRVRGSGPANRISHSDLDSFLRGTSVRNRASGKQQLDDTVKSVKIVGLRRKIAEQMARSKSRIPHITYVEEIDMTALEDLRARLNGDRKDDQTKLTLLPFLMLAMVRAIADHPQMNARFDDDSGVLHQFAGMHMGVAAQTETGLVVPVVRHVEAKGIWECASELGRLAESARSGTATREELSGSTITITSLGKLGGVVTTPVINHPEVAIIGVNKMRTLPVWQGGEFVPRQMMNLSSSFDHRVVDGWDAANFIQRVKALLESPATIFIED
ncbi:MAG: dihydrolipoamide acetyltransferase family protein [Pseudomonadota bacterium]